VSWNAYFHPKFKAEFDKLSDAVQDELLASLTPLREYGPALGRPEVDTLNGFVLREYERTSIQG
jgi:hypothetical protein